MLFTMKTSLVITIVGPDQTGLVDSLSSLISEHGGSWLESRMSRLAGQFAGILHVSVDQDKTHALSTALQTIENLNIVVETAQSSEPETPAHSIEIEVVGHDRPGIVQQVSHALASLSINVDDLHTELESAPMSGELLFKANARLGVPEGVSAESLYEKLEALADDIIVTISEQETKA